ncbi:alpha/beta fold hydrolase [Streptomyces sp. NPDC057638]|uniref:alpha/beta fold hydrolase n=1 Tax=Streptomyces sp. NPDC057638 TaxID=3346190 RepID=UPI00368C266A
MTLDNDIAGSGPTLVLLHSTVCDRRMWDPQWRALVSAGYRVVRCDFRGYGGTPATMAPHSDADDVLALLDGIGADRVTLIGASHGGRVALEVAARVPHRVAALALLCSGPPPGPRLSPELAAFDDAEDVFFEQEDIKGATELNARFWLGPEATEATREFVREMQYHAFELQLAAERESMREGTVGEDGPQDPPEPATGLGSGDDGTQDGTGDGTGDSADDGTDDGNEFDFDALTAVTAPALVLTGAHDVPDFRATAERLAVLLPGARHEELPWAGHLPGLERPEEITHRLLEFLDEAGELAR